MATGSSFPVSCVLLTILIAFFASPSTADENNLLLTGEVLGTDNQLSNTDGTFVMQGDCNLVLYNKANGFQSNTHGKGVNCTLTLSDYGQLIIRSNNGTAVWTSPHTHNSKIGKYAAILRPDGQVAIYGTSVWSTPEWSSSLWSTPEWSSSANDEKLQATPVGRNRNILFSNLILYKDSKLTTRDYTFLMRKDCNLALVKGSQQRDIWNSGTQGRGKNCYARLGHRAQLAIDDFRFNTLWTSNPVSTNSGEYVLILQINGQAVIYGPLLWSTASSLP